jgi:hypothetical protein
MGAVNGAPTSGEAARARSMASKGERRTLERERELEEGERKELGALIEREGIGEGVGEEWSAFNASNGVVSLNLLERERGEGEEQLCRWFPARGEADGCGQGAGSGADGRARNACHAHKASGAGGRRRGATGP